MIHTADLHGIHLQGSRGRIQCHLNQLLVNHNLEQNTRKRSQKYPTPCTTRWTFMQRCTNRPHKTINRTSYQWNKGTEIITIRTLSKLVRTREVAEA
jgi:hypothetical protein